MNKNDEITWQTNSTKINKNKANKKYINKNKANSKYA